MIIPRDYQAAATESIFEYYQAGNTGNPVVAMPTGTGKSITIGDFATKALHRYPGTSIIALTHVKELVEQNATKLRGIWPYAPYGIYSAGLKSRDHLQPIIFGSCASVVRKLELFGKRDLGLIDECHLVGPSDEAMYQKIIAHFKAQNPYFKIIGFTATDYRMGQGQITDGGIFTDVCFDMTSLGNFNWFIEQGYLVPLFPRRTAFELDVSGVKLDRGEFQSGSLSAAIDKDDVNYAALRETVECGYNRRSWLVFTSSIEHAEHVAAQLQGFGINAAAVHSKQPTKDRDARIAAYKSGELRCIVNKDILTTGFDDPKTDMIVMLRPTMSPGLWVQMLGRGTRPDYAEGFDLGTTEGRLAAIATSYKHNCLVLDFAANTKRLGPINDPVKPRKKGAGGGDAPVWICDECNSYNHASARFCIVCGAEHIFENKLKKQSGNEELIRSDIPEYVDYDVDRVFYALHTKISGPPSVKVTYACGLLAFNEFQCFEHGGFAAKRARDWWRQRDTTGGDPPETCEEALLRISTLAAPTKITVIVNRQYPQITQHFYM